tara:strand:+ start:525 stop:740 length:216 start_codon:yes stop_codon:yes gene_type:complete
MNKITNHRLKALEARQDWEIESLENYNEKELRDVWLQAWTATASSTNCINVSSCTKFANACLTAYKEKFNL